MTYDMLLVMTREGTAPSGLPDDVETLKQLLIQKNEILVEKNHRIADIEAAISGKEKASILARLKFVGRHSGHIPRQKHFKFFLGVCFG